GARGRPGGRDRVVERAIARGGLDLGQRVGGIVFVGGDGERHAFAGGHDLRGRGGAQRAPDEERDRALRAPRGVRDLVRDRGRHLDRQWFSRWGHGRAAYHDLPMLRGEVGAAAPFNEIEVGGVRLAYNDEGYGPAVVCLHAIGHGARDYAGLRLRLR